MVRCIQAACGHVLPRRVNFCPYCGTAQGAAGSTQLHPVDRSDAVPDKPLPVAVPVAAPAPATRSEPAAPASSAPAPAAGPGPTPTPTPTPAPAAAAGPGVP